MFKKNVFEDEFQSIVSDLFILSSHQQIGLLANGSLDVDYIALAQEFYIFSQSKKKYDQVRLLDLNGQEIIRINYDEGQPKTVPRNQLQSKKNRYYFKDTLDLKKGEIFVSPFDLNIENGNVEIPFKPTIRFGVPIFTSTNEKVGVVLVNYFGDKLLRQIERVPYEVNASGFGILLNNEGYYLKGMVKESEWGFMIQDRGDHNFYNDFSELRDVINNNFSGQIITEDGLFTYSTVYPLAEGLKSSSGTPTAFGNSVKSLNATDYFWKIISYIPRENILRRIDLLKDSLIIVNIVFIFIIGIGSRILALSVTKRKEAEEKLKHLAHYDHLTGLPNRKTLYDRMNMSMAVSKRENKHFFVFFIDLDGFKAVNDNFGHDTGDKLITEAATRLKDSVRESDTVARIGGDEFVVLLNSIQNISDVGTIADKILEKLSEDFSNSVTNYSITASIGIAIFPKDGVGQNELLNSADTAMYNAKQSGKNTYRFYQQ
ncbi:MAG: diguanylate cyclase [Bacteroidetes bacterium]|nr:diguanylate cyclase [Bacteroidota bacterium]